MRIHVIGEEAHYNECQDKFGAVHQYRFSRVAEVPDLKNQEVVFDFIPEANHFRMYSDFPQLIVFTEASRQPAKNWLTNPASNPVFGFAGLPTLFNRPLLEVSITNSASESQLMAVCSLLGTPYKQVSDEAGLITPRIICMIINEAYCTYEEGIASREDIDRAMVLGTAYPFGPFEWCKRIGINHVVGVLGSMAQEDAARYRISRSLLEENKAHSS